MNPRGMKSGEQAQNWESAFPGGNGSIGVLIMGNPLDETIIVNHERLFLPMHGRVNLPTMHPYMPEIRRLIRAGQYRQAASYYVSKSAEQGLTGLCPDYFHPAFEIKIQTQCSELITDYSRAINFESGEIITSWKGGATHFQRNVFVSRADQVIVTKYCSENGELPVCKIGLVDSDWSVGEDSSLPQQYLLKTEKSCAVPWLTHQLFYKNTPGGCLGAARIICRGGTISEKNGFLVVGNSQEILVLCTIAPAEFMTEAALSELVRRLAICPDDYNVLRDRHSLEHGELFNRVALDLSGGDERDYTNEALIDKCMKEGMPNALVERMHDFGRYLLICSAGDLPPNAQGIWNGTWRASNLPDYVTNIELEMATWPALQGNLPECLRGYFDFVESLLPDWTENAQKLYGCRGVLASSRSSNHGQFHHFSEEYPHEFWTAGAGWMAQTFYDYWLYTGDREFLLQRCLPLMKEVATFYGDFLQTGDAGKLCFIPSLSPENNPANSNSQAAINATMDIAVARELLANLITASEQLDIEQENIGAWKERLARLPEYQINPNGSLKEWADLDLQDNYRHRHLSHLYPIMPGFEARQTENNTLREACQTALNMRIENGLFNMCGWSLGHAANAAARLSNPELLHQFLSAIAKSFVNPNLMTKLDQRLSWVQVDANFCFTAAVNEALVYSQPGTIELFPALPVAWRKGKTGGICCRGGINVISLEWHLGEKSAKVCLESAVDQQLLLRVHGASNLKAALANTTMEVPNEEESVHLLANQPAEFTFMMK